MAKEEVDPCVALREFLEQCAATPSEVIVVGIDPGANGAIGFLCDRVYLVMDIPTVKVEVTRVKTLSKKEQKATGNKTKKEKGKSTRFNYAVIGDLFRVLRDVKSRVSIILEQAPIRMGPVFTNGDVLLNRAYAMWPLFLHYNSYQLEEVVPVIWKRAMGLTKDKERSRLKAMKMYPKADIKLKKHEGRAEALLLAAYWQRVLRGG